MSKLVKIKAHKFPDILHYEWEGELIHFTSEYVLVLCKPGRQLIHHTKSKVFTIENTSIEYFSLQEWFTAAMEVENGKVVSTYCNVAKPSIFVNGEIRFVDLDLDYVQEKDREWTVVDADEFESNSTKYGYPRELKREAIQALVRLKEEVSQGNFPFNPSIAEIF